MTSTLESNECTVDAQAPIVEQVASIARPVVPVAQDPIAIISEDSEQLSNRTTGDLIEDTEEISSDVAYPVKESTEISALTPSNYEDESARDGLPLDETESLKSVLPPPVTSNLSLNEDSQSSALSVTSRTTDPILKQSSLFSAISAASIIEYQWPENSGEYFMIQEQISSYLGVTSFKRKYPEIDRHKLDPQELNHLMLKMLVSEVQVTLGLTAVRSSHVCDMMMRDFPEKYQDYLQALDEKRKENIKGKHQQYSTPAVEKSQLPNYMKKAMRQVSDFNARLNRHRKEEYSVYYDMQTNVLQFPSHRLKKLHPDLTRPSLYPCSLIPGQFQEFCQKYTPDELSYFPLNTVIYGPPPPLPDIDEISRCSDSEPEQKSNDIKQMEVQVPEIKSPEKEEEDSEPKEGKSDKSSSHASEDPEIPEENSNSAHSFSNRDTEATNDSLGIKEESMESFIEDPDKPICGICLKDETSNKKGDPEDLISCSQCDNYGHPSCLDMSKELVSVIVTYNWQCLECKTCTYCNKPHHEDKMMFCDRCDRGYHTFCVGLRNLPSGLWMCPQCTRLDPDFAKKGGGRKGTRRKRKIPKQPPQNPDGTPKPKRKRRTKKEMEAAREKERLEKEEKMKKRMEIKEEKQERKKRRRSKKNAENINDDKNETVIEISTSLPVEGESNQISQPSEPSTEEQNEATEEVHETAETVIDEETVTKTPEIEELKPDNQSEPLEKLPVPQDEVVE